MNSFRSSKKNSKNISISGNNYQENWNNNNESYNTNNYIFDNTSSRYINATINEQFSKIKISKSIVINSKINDENNDSNIYISSQNEMNNISLINNRSESSNRQVLESNSKNNEEQLIDNDNSNSFHIFNNIFDTLQVLIILIIFPP